MKLKVAYHYFVENLKRKLKSTEGQRKYSLLTGNIGVRSKNINTFHWQTQLLRFIITINLIFTLEVSHSEFHSSIFW